MKANNVLKLFIIFIFLILCISSVSAADDINETNSADDTALAVNNEITTEDNILTAPEDGTFAELKAIINSAEAGSTIELDRNYVFTSWWYIKDRDYN